MTRRQAKRTLLGFGARLLGAVLSAAVAFGLACRPQVLAVCTQSADCGYGRLCAVGRCENETDGGTVSLSDAGKVLHLDAGAWTRSVQSPVAAGSLEPTLAVRRTTAWCEMEEAECLLRVTLHDCLDEVMARAFVTVGRQGTSHPAPRLQGKNVTFEGLIEPESASGEQQWSFALRGGAATASGDGALFREACDEPGVSGSRRCAIRIGRALERSAEGDSLKIAPAHPRDRVEQRGERVQAERGRGQIVSRQGGVAMPELRAFVLDVYSRPCNR
jgi:hypothetical protein